MRRAETKHALIEKRSEIKYKKIIFLTEIEERH